MKRERIGFALLLGLLILGLLVTRYMDTAHQDMAEKLDSAQILALAEDWDGAGRLVRSARKEWEGVWRVTATLTDHAVLEQIDSLLAQLDLYQKQKEALAFASTCAQISSYLQDLGHANALTLWNIL